MNYLLSTVDMFIDELPDISSRYVIIDELPAISRRCGHNELPAISDRPKVH